MFTWSFRRKLVTAVILVCVLTTLASIVSLITAGSLLASMAKLTTANGQGLADARALQSVGLETIADVRACLLQGGKAFAPESRAGSTKTHELAARLRTRITDADGRLLLHRVVSAERAHDKAFEHALARAGARVGAAPSVGSEPVLSQSIAFERALEALVSNRETASEQQLALALAEAKHSEHVLVAVSIAKLTLMVLLCLIISVGLMRSDREQTVAGIGRTPARGTLLGVEATSPLMDEFLATVSHELRNPLAAILTWTQLLRSGSLDREKTVRALDVIERSVLSQTRLIDDLMDVSRVVSGKFLLDVGSVDLVPVIKSAAELLRPASEAKEIRLHLQLDERSVVMSGDPERLQQVMSNLISNAIKFTPNGGEVEVVLRRGESDIVVEVRDNGIGIERAFLAQLFEPLRQGTGGSGPRPAAGLGLGLLIVHHIVELHGGEISAHSGGPGQGAKFIVKFPLPRARSGPGGPQATLPAL